MAAHELSVGQSDEWYTPPEVFTALSLRFDMDVASPGENIVPWVPANRHITENSLQKEWAGLVWMNPPFGARNGYFPWAEKFVAHGNGVALSPDRTSAPWWQWLAARSDAVFFWSPKIHFIKPDGGRGKSPGTGTSLFAIGAQGVSALASMDGINGAAYLRIGSKAKRST